MRFRQKYPSHLRLKIHFVGPLILLAFVLGLMGCKGGPSHADEALQKAIKAGQRIGPETLYPGNWEFWCRSVWPDGQSKSDHFVQAAKYAQRSASAYNGPNTWTSETYDWPLVFVEKDGSYKEVLLSSFRFEIDMEGHCSKKGEYKFVIRDDTILLQKVIQ